MARQARRATRRIAHEALHDTVLEGVKADHDQTAAGRQQAARLIQRAFDLAKFVVHPDAQRLKAASCGIDARTVRRQHVANDRSESCRRGDGRHAASGNNRTRDAAGRAFFTEVEQQVGKLALRQRVDQIGCGRAGTIHPHIQRAIATKREAASRFVELIGGHAHVQHHAVKSGNAALGQQVEHVAELAVDQMQAAWEPGGEAGAAGDGVRIAVDRPQCAGRRVQDRAGIAAAAECAIQVNAAGARSEHADCLGQHDGHVGWAWDGSLRRNRGNGEAMLPGPLACLGASAVGRSRFPDLESASKTHEHHGVGQPGV